MLSDAKRRKMRDDHLTTMANIDAATARKTAALDSFARAITDLRPILAKARGLPLALGPHTAPVCDGLVAAGVAKRIEIGSKVMWIEKGTRGVVTGWTDGNTEVLVKGENGDERTAKAGKRETEWHLAVVE